MGSRIHRHEPPRRISWARRPSRTCSLTRSLADPDFAKIAEAAGLLGLSATRPEHVRPMIAQALEHDGPVLVEVLVHRRELAMPPSISLEQVTGFGIFMAKTVLGGRGDELIDLAKTNLFR
jgi:pyruvate dehydrogenase (quinone)